MTKFININGTRINVDQIERYYMYEENCEQSVIILKSCTYPHASITVEQLDKLLGVKSVDSLKEKK